MKLQRALDFEPRRLHSPPRGKSDQPVLRAENPWFARGIDIVHISTEVASEHLQNPTLQAGAGLVQGGVAVAASVWGINKLVRGQGVLDRVDGVASLAMAADSALQAAGFSQPALALALTLIHATGEFIVGGADVLRGHQEDHTHRLAAGAFQVLTGAGTMASFFPATAVLGQAMLMTGLLGRQAALTACPS